MQQDPISRDATLGLAVPAQRPCVLLSELCGAFEAAIKSDIRDYSPDQLRR